MSDPEVWNWQEIQALEIEAISDTPCFLFLWCGAEEGLEAGRVCMQVRGRGGWCARRRTMRLVHVDGGPGGWGGAGRGGARWGARRWEGMSEWQGSEGRAYGGRERDDGGGARGAVSGPWGHARQRGRWVAQGAVRDLGCGMAQRGTAWHSMVQRGTAWLVRRAVSGAVPYCPGAASRSFLAPLAHSPLRHPPGVLLARQKWGFRRCEDICWIKTNKDLGKRPYLKAANQHPESMLVHTKVRGRRGSGGSGVPDGEAVPSPRVGWKRKRRFKSANPPARLGGGGGRRGVSNVHGNDARRAIRRRCVASPPSAWLAGWLVEEMTRG